MTPRIAALLRDEHGPTAVEYALMVGAVAGIIIAIVFVFGGRVKNLFLNTADHL